MRTSICHGWLVAALLLAGVAGCKCSSCGNGGSAPAPGTAMSNTTPTTTTTVPASGAPATGAPALTPVSAPGSGSR
jgi:hypothetical protein